MGMDVYGIEPKTDAGEYFRNNVWYWRPLWNYCLSVSGDLIDGNIGHDNSGEGLDAYQAEQLAEILEDQLSKGHTLKYKQTYDAMIASIPRDVCEYCEGTGIRSDEVGVEHKMPERPLEVELAILLGRSQGWCNACRGEGMKDSWESAYPFEVDNVREFAKFCRDSGGFNIY
jgi:hypothetical protein